MSTYPRIYKQVRVRALVTKLSFVDIYIYNGKAPMLDADQSWTFLNFTSSIKQTCSIFFQMAIPVSYTNILVVLPTVFDSHFDCGHKVISCAV